MSDDDRKVMDKHIIPAYENDVLYVQEQEIVKQLYMTYTGKRRKWSKGCGNCWKEAINELIEIYHASCPKSE